MTTKHTLKQIRACFDITQEFEDADLSISFELSDIEGPNSKKIDTSNINNSEKPTQEGHQVDQQQLILIRKPKPPSLHVSRYSEVHITPQITDRSPEMGRSFMSFADQHEDSPNLTIKNVSNEDTGQPLSPDKSIETFRGRRSTRRRRYRERTDYFVQDAEQDPLRIKEYDINFRYTQFLEFLFYHILFFFGLGPLSFILLYPIAGRVLTKNMGFAGFNITFLLQSFLWAFLFSSVFLWSYGDHGRITNVEIILVISSAFLRICVISSKYGSMHPLRVQLLRKRYLSFEELTQDYMLYKWIAQTDDIIEQELIASVKRHEIDTALFFFNFITTIDAETKKKLTRTRTSVAKMSSSLLAKQFLRAKTLVRSVIKRKTLTSDTTPKPVTPEDSSLDRSKLIEPQIQQIAESATKAKQERLFAKKKSNLLTATLDNIQAFDMLSGVNLAREIIFEARKKGIPKVLVLSGIAGFIRALIPLFHRLSEGNPALGETVVQKYIAMSFIICNNYFFSMNLAFVLVGLSDLRRKFYLMGQLSNLLSVRKLEEYSSEKLYPTMNIFDPISLRAWINLQKIFMDFGRKYFLRINLNISIFLLFYAIIVAIILLQIFAIMNLFAEKLLIYVFLYELALILGIIILSIITGASINDHFRVHTSIIQKNKTVASDLLQLDDVYFPSMGSKFKASNILYQEGVSKIRFLVKLSGYELGSPEAAEVIQDYLSKLVAFNDNAIEELEFEKVNNPVKILGFITNRELVSQIFVGILTVGFAVLQKNLRL